MKVDTLTPKLVDSFHYDGVEAKELASVDWKNEIRNRLLVGPGWSVDKDGQQILIFGFFKVSAGVAQGWMLFNQESKKHSRTMAKVMSEKSNWVMDQGMFHRIQIYLMSTDIPGIKYIQLMGFKYEAVLEKYSHDRQDMVIYKMTRGK